MLNVDMIKRSKTQASSNKDKNCQLPVKKAVTGQAWKNVTPKYFIGPPINISHK